MLCLDFSSSLHRLIMLRLLITVVLTVNVSLAFAQQNSSPNTTSSFKHWGAAMVSAYSCEIAARDAGMPRKVIRTWELMRATIIYANDILPYSLSPLETEAEQNYSNAGNSIMMEICVGYLQVRNFDKYMNISDKFWSNDSRIDSYYRYFHANYVCMQFFASLIELRQKPQYQNQLNRFLAGNPSQSFSLYSKNKDQQWALIEGYKREHDEALNVSGIRTLRKGPEGRHELQADQLLLLGFFYPGLDWLGEYTVSEDLVENFWNMFGSCSKFTKLPKN